MFKPNKTNARILIKNCYLSKDSKCITGVITQDLDKEIVTLQEWFSYLKDKLSNDIIINDGIDKNSTHIVILSDLNTKKMKSFSIKIKYYSSEDLMNEFLKVLEHGRE